ncbi:H/ACA ribonucleoprotein complex subunit 2-like protein [Gryllus bimaculatus]|nr:H/ACA ribonucleoprotein complex subunit 2-like protein [Gryllus bimaculatus]
MADNGEVEGKEITYDEKLSWVNEIAKPIATKHVAKKIYKVVKKASKNKKNLMVGIKLVQKALRKNQKGMVIFAGDVTPIEIMCHLPGMCEERDIPYCYVPSKLDLGAAMGCGERACVVMMISDNPEYKDSYDELKEQIKVLPYPL